MKGRLIAIAALLLVVVVIAWNALFFGPAGEDVDKAKQRETSAQQAQSQLDATLRSLRAIAAQGPEFQAKIDKLNGAVPVTPDLEGFIRTANELKSKAGVDWVSIQPATPTAGTGPSEIRMQVVVSGGFFQVLDYLNRLEALQRIVVVDSINVTTAGENTSSGGSSTPTSAASRNGAPNLTVTLSARMFTQATTAGSTGTRPGSGSGATSGATTTTSRPTATTAGGNT